MRPLEYTLPRGVSASTVAHLYSRVSRTSQVDGDGLRRQAAATTEWVREHGLVIKETYSDRGVSSYRGRNRTHGELGVILSRIEDGTIRPGEHLILEGVDRLSRQEPTEAMETLNAILRKGVIVHSVFDRKAFTHATINRDNGLLLTVIIGMMRANEESRLKGERVAQAYQRKREEGIDIGSKAPAWIEVIRDDKGKRAGFRLIETRVRLLETIFGMAADGLTTYAICKWLNARYEPWTLPNKRNRDRKVTWNANYVHRIITGRTVLGEMEACRYEHRDSKAVREPVRTIFNYYPAAITADLWQRAQKGVQRGKSKGNTGKGFGNLFTRAIYCAHCGGTMDRSHNEKRVFFRCRTHARGGCENKKTIGYAGLEEEVISFVEEIKLADTRNTERASLESSLAELRLRAEQTETELRRIITTFAGVKTALKMVEEKQAELDGLETTIREHEGKLAAIATAESPHDRRAAFYALKAKLRATVDEEERAQIRAALNSRIRDVVSRFECTHEGLIIAYLHGNDGEQYVFHRTVPGKFGGIALNRPPVDVSAPLPKTRWPTAEERMPWPG